MPTRVYATDYKSVLHVEVYARGACRPIVGLGRLVCAIVFLSCVLYMVRVGLLIF